MVAKTCIVEKKGHCRRRQENRQERLTIIPRNNNSIEFTLNSDEDMEFRDTSFDVVLSPHIIVD